MGQVWPAKNVTCISKDGNIFVPEMAGDCFAQGCVGQLNQHTCILPALLLHPHHVTTCTQDQMVMTTLHPTNNSNKKKQDLPQIQVGVITFIVYHIITLLYTTPHLTSPHLTSPHLTSPHLTSPHLTSPHHVARTTCLSNTFLPSSLVPSFEL